MSQPELPEIDYFDVLENRRSVFAFDSDKNLDDNLLRKIINKATLAPSSYNLQPWRILAVKSKEMRKQVYEEACSQQKVLDAPVLLIILGDKDGYHRYNPAWNVKKKLGKVNEEKIKKIIKHNDNVTYNTSDKKLAFAIRNSSLLAMSIMFTAKAFGVDTHPMIGFKPEKIREIFELEDNIKINMLISVGYHDQSHQVKPREERLDYEQIVTEY
ncbi:MAG: nitroreductase family protein [Bacillota bacterium]